MAASTGVRAMRCTAAWAVSELASLTCVVLVACVSQLPSLPAASCRTAPPHPADDDDEAEAAARAAAAEAAARVLGCGYASGNEFMTAGMDTTRERLPCPVPSPANPIVAASEAKWAAEAEAMAS